MSNEPKPNQLTPVKSTNRGLMIKSSSLVKRGLMQLLEQESRTVRFPKDRSLGELYVRDVNSNDFLEWEFFGEAKGDVTVPLSKDLQLNIRNIEEIPLDLSPLKNLNSDDLYGLCLSFNLRINDEDLINIQGLKNLKELIIGSIYITDTGFDYIGKLTNLESLSLSNIKKITGEGLVYLQGLKNLEYLDLNGTDITDEGIDYLSILTNLGSLRLLNTGISNYGIRKLQKALPNCIIGYFTKNK